MYLQVKKKLNLWVINDVIWFKRNAAPLLSKNRLAPSTELIWVASKTKKYYFDEILQAYSGEQLQLSRCKNVRPKLAEKVCRPC